MHISDPSEKNFEHAAPGGQVADRARARPVGGVKRSLTAVKQIMVPLERIELSASPLPRVRSTTELQRPISKGLKLANLTTARAEKMTPHNLAIDRPCH